MKEYDFELATARSYGFNSLNEFNKARSQVWKDYQATEIGSDKKLKFYEAQKQKYDLKRSTLAVFKSIVTLMSPEGNVVLDYDAIKDKTIGYTIATIQKSVSILIKKEVLFKYKAKSGIKYLILNEWILKDE